MQLTSLVPIATTAAVVIAMSLSACGGGSSSGAVAIPAPTVTVSGAPTISTATAGNGQAILSFTAPDNTGGAAISTYTGSCTAGAATLQASAATSPIIVTGLTNGTPYTCSVTASNSAGTSTSSTSVTVLPLAPVASGGTTYAAPAPFTSILSTSYQAASLKQASAFTNRGRYLVSDSAASIPTANYLAVGSTYSATTGFTVLPTTLASTSTYNSYLTKLIQVVSDASGYFRFDSHLHPNNAIDVDASDGNKLKFRNNFGKAAVTYGYVTFSFDSVTRLIQARKRYTYSYNATTNVASYTEDTAFVAANHYVSLSNGVYQLVASASLATSFYLYESPLDFGIPTNMNPGAVAFVTNAAAPFGSRTTVANTEGPNGVIVRNVNATYQAQVAAAGSNAATKQAADAMLDSIKAAVEGAGEKLRYTPAVYTAFRDGALSTTLVSDAVADGTPGQNLVPYVYFTNEKDADGKFHPFMIVVNYANPASPHGLQDVPHPPGDGQGAGYAAQKVTRFTNLDNRITSIPMKDYGVVSAVTDNTLARTLLSDVGGALSTADVYNYASTADIGLLINGMVMFPVYNNRLVPSQADGELSASGCHIGQGGGGPHCHADGSQNAAAPGVGLYADSDYLNQTHPPLIGFGYDGVALFARYRAGKDAAMRGASVVLDGFGGHNHDGVGYHFHAHEVADYSWRNSTTKYTLNVLVKGAFIGRINSVPFFGANGSFTDNKYLGGSAK
jgi:hypothetical protein